MHTLTQTGIALLADALSDSFGTENSIACIAVICIVIVVFLALLLYKNLKKKNENQQ